MTDMSIADRAWDILAHAFIPAVAVLSFGITQLQTPTTSGVCIISTEQ